MWRIRWRRFSKLRRRSLDRVRRRDAHRERGVHNRDQSKPTSGLESAVKKRGCSTTPNNRTDNKMHNSTSPSVKPKTNPPQEGPRFKYLVQWVLLSERAAWECSSEDSYIELELERLTENGEEIVSLLRDEMGDIQVFLKVAVTGGL